MGRRTAKVTISAEGRDIGKTFVLHEMPSDQGERWAIRAMLGLIQSGVHIEESQLRSGLAGLATLGIMALGGLPWEVLEPLLAEMWQCVRYEHKPGAPPQVVFEGVNSQIEEVSTRVQLRMAVFELHLGFSIPEVTPTSGSQQGNTGDSSTPTFLQSLVNWYRRGLQRS